VLLMSIIALFLGPLLYQWLRRGGLIARTVEGGIVAVLALLVVFLLVPESVEALGLWALALMVTGYLLPGLLEIAVRRAAHAFHVISLVIALSGLALHAMLDGAGLAGSRGDGGSLSVAIVLHRFGVGLLLWFMVQPVFGRRVAGGVLVGVSVATLVGYWLSDTLVTLEEPQFVHVVQALIIGTILHSLVHRGHVHTHPGAPPDVHTGRERDQDRS
jgi:hypothetical protein